MAKYIFIALTTSNDNWAILEEWHPWLKKLSYIKNTRKKSWKKSKVKFWPKLNILKQNHKSLKVKFFELWYMWVEGIENIKKKYDILKRMVEVINANLFNHAMRVKIFWTK